MPKILVINKDYFGVSNWNDETISNTIPKNLTYTSLIMVYLKYSILIMKIISSLGFLLHTVWLLQKANLYFISLATPEYPHV